MFFFTKKPTVKQKIVRFIETMLVGTGIVMYWRGLWNLMETYFLPSDPILSNILSIVVGVSILVLTGKFVEQIFGDVDDEIYL